MSLSKPARKHRSKTIVKLEELVKCAVCHELLNNPKVFPCLHSYCYECKQKVFCSFVCKRCIYFKNLLIIYKLIGKSCQP